MDDTWLDAWQRDAAALTETTRRLAVDISTLTASASDPGRLVTVSVDSGGLLRDLRLTRQAMTRPPEDLAERILSATRLARADIADAVAELAAAVSGPATEAAREIADSYRDRFPREVAR
ncbi:YbaB/EbfC family nucleoid-associated protein [Phytomonospora sp. NPDC050363]|uniref:YbaB/EbfC family nucleoid-associated protein n=1 Tax=Phytomonospora sp. NPDC050363 TaxID=3155642 RepID=UPI0033CC53CF